MMYRSPCQITGTSEKIYASRLFTSLGFKNNIHLHSAFPPKSIKLRIFGIKLLLTYETSHRKSKMNLKFKLGLQLHIKTGEGQCPHLPSVPSFPIFFFSMGF